MDYVRRFLQSKIEEFFSGEAPEGLILAGIVGAGKTTLAKKVLENLKSRYSVHSFTGDDVRFRDVSVHSNRWKIT